jgi:hypothetical protein
MDSKPWKPKTAKRQRTGTQFNAPHKLHAVCKYISGGKKTKKKKKKKKKSNVLSFAAALILRSRKDVDEADAGFFGFNDSSSSSFTTTDLPNHKLAVLTETQWLKIAVVVVVVLLGRQAKDSLAPFLAFKEESWSPPAAKARLATEELDTMSAIEEGGAWPHTRRRKLLSKNPSTS